MVAGLKEIDAVVGNEVNDSMLLGKHRNRANRHPCFERKWDTYAIAVPYTQPGLFSDRHPNAHSHRNSNRYFARRWPHAGVSTVCPSVPRPCLYD